MMYSASVLFQHGVWDSSNAVDVSDALLAATAAAHTSKVRLQVQVQSEATETLDRRHDELCLTLSKFHVTC